MKLGRTAALPIVPALVAFAVALACSLLLPDILHPPLVFPKYLAAAVASPAERLERMLDYSPLYLGLVTALLPWGYTAILVAQAFLHACVAAVAALSAGRLAGRRSWAWLAGLGVATYRPFLTYVGVHEPEIVILACLSLAILCGLVARDRLAAGAAGSPGSSGSSGDGGNAGARGGRGAALGTAIVVALAFAGLAAAALGRPQHLLLIPVWALWIGAAASAMPVGRRRAARGWVWGAALLIPAFVLAPPVLARARATGVPTIMDPGAVIYEGNGPGAVGLIRYAPRAVIDLEHAHGESIDYGHVAYRRIAAAALGHQQEPAAAGRRLGSAAANRYWTALALESARAWPAAEARLLGRKLLMSLMPYEGHDLVVTERLDRALRRWLPWGFAVPLLALPWIALSRRHRLVDLAGPLAVVAIACAVQVAGYASARQRLPAALALWILLPPLAADLLGGRLRAAIRPALALLLGLAVPLGLGAATARIAVLDQLGWDRLLTPGPAAPTAPTAPGASSLPGVPGAPDLPGALGRPGGPATPGDSAAPGIPGGGGVPGSPDFPGALGRFAGSTTPPGSPAGGSPGGPWMPEPAADSPPPPPARGLGEVLCALQDGRALRPRLRQEAEVFEAGAALAAHHRPAASLRVLAPLLGTGADFTIDDRQVGVPEFWAALDLATLGRRADAASQAALALAIRPQDLRIAVLARRLALPPGSPGEAGTEPSTSGTSRVASSAGSGAAGRAFAPGLGGPGGWRPAGVDPVSARLLAAWAAAATGDRAAGLEILAPLGADFPDLIPARNPPHSP